MSRWTLIRYIDVYGLTVFRHPLTHNRYFLASEVQELKEVMPTITAEEVRKAKALEEERKARGFGLLQVIRLIRG